MITSRKTASSKFIETLLGRKRLRVLLGVLVSHCLVVAGSLHAVEVSVVAFQGDRIVGLDEDETLAQWDLPFGINHRGEVAFSGLVHQTASNGDVQQAGKGIWMGRPGEIKLLARNGQQAPGFDEGMVFSELVSPFSFNNRGEIAFLSWVGSTRTDKEKVALFVGKPGEVRLISKNGDPAVGFEAIGGLIEFQMDIGYSIQSFVSLSDTGDVAWTAGVDERSAFGLWVSLEKSTILISPLDENLHSGHFSQLSSGRGGEVAFVEKRLIDTLYLWKDSTLTTVVREGVEFGDESFLPSGVNKMVMKDDGTIVFGASSRDEIFMGHRQSLWEWNGDRFRSVAFPETDIVPGQFDSRVLSFTPSLGAGLITYSSCAQTPEDQSNRCVSVSLIDNGLGSQVIAYEGMPFPGGPEGATVTYENFKGALFRKPVTNENGIILAYIGQKLADGTVIPGVYQYTSSGYAPIVKEGDEVFLDSEIGSTATVFNIYNNRRADVAMRSLNNRDELILAVDTLEKPTALAVLSLGNVAGGPLKLTRIGERLELGWDGEGLLERAATLEGPWLLAANQSLSQVFQVNEETVFYRARP